MPEPEIARRCPTCGASIREVALFCPQCGNGLGEQKAAQSQTGLAVVAERTISKNTASLNEPTNTGSLNESKGEAKDDSKGDSTDESAQSLADTVAIPKADEPATSAADSAKPAAAPRVRGAVGTKIQRATTLARDVEGDVIDRARKVRKMSSVVIDEASYDPSLRFVLVAVGLFVLFVIIVLLNKVIT